MFAQNNYFQFKIILDCLALKVWRRIQIHERSTFDDLHQSIQKAMGWKNENPYFFEMHNPNTHRLDRIEFCLDPIDVEGIKNSKTTFIGRYFIPKNAHARYTYDFRDSWLHNIMLEKIAPKEKNIVYPRCIEGQKACPPENCGGIHSYANILTILNDPDHPDHVEIINWCRNESFDPDFFAQKDLY